VPDPTVASLSWSDMRRDSLTQDFEAMGKSCGQCHAKEFEEFQRSAMGMNAKQKQYAGWHSARGRTIAAHGSMATSNRCRPRPRYP